MSPPPTTVVYCFDKGYAPYGAVSTFSLISNAKSALKIFWIVPHEDQASIVPLLSAVEEKTGQSVTLITVLPDLFDTWKVINHISRGTYLRLLIPSLINESRVIYLDADTLILSDLSPLFSMDMGNHLIAGVKDPGDTIAQFPRHAGDPYLNAGVLLMNLDALRADGFLEKAQALYQKHETEIVYLDQCLINKYAEGRKLVVDSGWNDFSGWWIDAHLSISTYLRLLIPTLIKEPRVLYVDADTLVLSSLESLFSMDLKNCLLAGTPDVLGGQISKIPRSSEDTYLNAGVLLMDLDALRQDGMLDKAKTIYRAYEHQLVMHDQCLINKYAEGRKLVLDSKWNRLLAASTVTDVQFKELLTNESPAILHFVSHYKPWQRWCTPAVAEFWWHHADQAGIDELKPTEITSIDQSIMFSRILDANARYEEASERKEAIIQELISLVHQHRAESAEALSRSNQFMEELMSLTNRYQFSS